MRRMLLLVGAAVMAVVLVAAASGSAGSAQRRWVIQDLGTLGGRESEAAGINERGEVAGNSEVDGRWHVFVWRTGRMRDLGTLGGRGSWTPGNYEGAVSRAWESAYPGSGSAYSGVPINDRGSVIGLSDTISKPGRASSRHAFLWANGRLRDLGTSGGPESVAIAINNRGQVVGDADTKAINRQAAPKPRPVQRAFLWEKGKMRALDTLGGPESWASAVSQSGQVVGHADTLQTTKYGDPVTHAVIWAGGKILDLTSTEGSWLAVSGRGQVQLMPDGLSWVLWLDGRVAARGKLSPSPYSVRNFEYFRVNGMSDHGQVIGDCRTRKTWAGPFRPCVWHLGKIGVIGTSQGTALDINNRGQIVGRLGSLEQSRGFVWEAGTMRELESLPGGRWSYAVDINNRSQIVGWATTKNGQRHAVLWTLGSG